jgi:hypothetical protein
MIIVVEMRLLLQLMLLVLLLQLLQLDAAAPATTPGTATAASTAGLTAGLTEGVPPLRTTAQANDVPLPPTSREGPFLRTRQSRFLSTNDDEVEVEEQEEGEEFEVLDVAMLEALHKEISSEQYSQDGDLIWRQGTLYFVTEGSAMTTWSPSSSNNNNDNNNNTSSTSSSIYPNQGGGNTTNDDDFLNGSTSQSGRDDDDGHNEDDEHDQFVHYDDDDGYDDDISFQNRPDESYSEDNHEWPHSDAEVGEFQWDCFRYRDKDDTIPPECESLISSTTNNEQHGGDGQHGGGGGGDDYTSVVDNLVRMRIIVGMAQPLTKLGYMSHAIAVAINQVLLTTTPFEAFYFGEDSIQLPQDPQRLLEEQQWSQSADTSSYARSHSDSTYRALQLLHAWTTMERLPLSMKAHPEIVWYEARVDYAAFFEPHCEQENPKPIRHPRQLGNMTWLGQSYVDRNIENGVLVRHIEQIIQDMRGQEQGHLDSSTIYPTNSTTWTNLTYRQEVKDSTDFACALHMGKDGKPGKPVWTQAWMDRHELRIVSSEPLTLEFGLREWFGVSIGGITLLVATLLFCISSWHQSRQLEKEWKQVMLTEQGISDVLRLGWRYQTATTMEDDAKNNLSQQQLFLQIYEKRKFRRDDDSILPGGVEREEMEPSSRNTSQTQKISDSESDSNGGGKRQT